MTAYRIFPKVLLAAIVLILSCSSSPEILEDSDRALTTNDITQNRDMTQYEIGGHFWCHRRPFGNEEDRASGEKKVRDFIWQHWTEKKRGYIELSCAGIDTSDTAHYFIEPNKKGEWNIVHRHISKQSNDKFFRRDYVLNSVERVGNKSNDDWTLISKTPSGEIGLQLPF